MLMISTGNVCPWLTFGWQPRRKFPGARKHGWASDLDFCLPLSLLASTSGWIVMGLIFWMLPTFQPILLRYPSSVESPSQKQPGGLNCGADELLWLTMACYLVTKLVCAWCYTVSATQDPLRLFPASSFPFCSRLLEITVVRAQHEIYSLNKS